MSSFVTVLIIDKTGSVKESKIKREGFSDLELYKKAGFKSNDCFECRHTWQDIKCDTEVLEQICIFSKTKGSAGKENKYELPPPIDMFLYFGNMIIVRYDKEHFPVNITKEQWEKTYNKLFGGFESLDESEDESDEEEIDPSKLDKYGYEKDGFVVDDDELEECKLEEDDDDDEESDEVDSDDDDDESEDNIEYDSELSEEEYFKPLKN